jgi:hypothetical protein
LRPSPPRRIFDGSRIGPTKQLQQLVLQRPRVQPEAQGCVLHAKLSAESDTDSTSTDKGHTLIKVLEDGTIEFKTEINNEDGETIIAAHIHQGASGSNALRRATFSQGRRRARARSSRAAWRRHSGM